MAETLLMGHDDAVRFIPESGQEKPEDDAGDFWDYSVLPSRDQTEATGSPNSIEVADSLSLSHEVELVSQLLPLSPDSCDTIRSKATLWPLSKQEEACLLSHFITDLAPWVRHILLPFAPRSTHELHSLITATDNNTSPTPSYASHLPAQHSYTPS